MKVILRDSHPTCGGDLSFSLTIGKEYEVIGICADDFQLLNDKNEPIIYDASCFEVTDPSEPIFWESKFGSDGERYAHPSGWSAPGFFEDWHNGVPEIIEKFWTDLRRLCPWTCKTRQT